MKRFYQGVVDGGIAILWIIFLLRCDDNSTGPKTEAAKWSPVDAQLQENTIQCLSVDPRRPSRVYLGTIRGIYKSEDAGKTWVQSNEGLTSLDITAICVHRMQSDRLFCGTWAKGLFISEDAAKTWRNVNAGLPPLIASIHQPSDQTDTLWVGSSEGLYLSADDGKTWHKRWQGNRRVYTIYTPPQEHQVILMGVFLLGFLRSTNYGFTWSYINTGIRGSPGASDYAIDFISVPNTQGQLYAVSSAGFIYYSADQGSQWSSCFDNFTWQGCIGFAIDPNAADRFYMAMKNGKVYRSDDAGASWVMVGDQIQPAELTCFALLAGTKNVLLVGSKDHGLFRYVE